MATKRQRGDRKDEKCQVSLHLTAQQHKHLVYEMIIKGYTTYAILNTMLTDYQVSNHTVKRFIKELNEEITQEFQDKREIQRQVLILELVDLKNKAVHLHEKLACIDRIAKFIGLGSETINVNARTEVVDNKFTIELLEPKDKKVE